ncbi:MAG: orotate phosphoribosyltransferase [Acidobacteriota bacterium]
MKSQRLLKSIIEKSFKYSETPIFPLASGRMSNYYIDCRTILSYPEARELIGELILEKIDLQSVDSVGGMELGAFPIAIAVSDACYRITGRSLRVFIVRKQPKGHGLKKWLEGDVGEGDRALIVEDVVTSGRSTLTAIQRSREAGLIVSQIVSLVDRQEGGRANLEAADISFQALFTLEDLRSPE